MVSFMLPAHALRVLLKNVIHKEGLGNKCKRNIVMVINGLEFHLATEHIVLFQVIDFSRWLLALTSTLIVDA